MCYSFECHVSLVEKGSGVANLVYSILDICFNSLKNKAQKLFTFYVTILSILRGCNLSSPEVEVR